VVDFSYLYIIAAYFAAHIILLLLIYKWSHAIFNFIWWQVNV